MLGTRTELELSHDKVGCNPNPGPNLCPKHRGGCCAERPAEGLLDLEFPPLAAAPKPSRPGSGRSPAQELRGWWQAMLRGMTPPHHSSKALKGGREPSAGALVLGLEYENCQVLPLQGLGYRFGPCRGKPVKTL